MNVKELALESRRIYSHLQLSSENPEDSQNHKPHQRIQ